MDDQANILRDPELLRAAHDEYARGRGFYRPRSGGLDTEQQAEFQLKRNDTARRVKELSTEWGYACYEHYRQTYLPDPFDKLVKLEAADSKRILDLCCGPGATIRSLAVGLPERIYAFDKEPKYIEIVECLRSVLDLPAAEIVAEVCDAHHLPLAARAVDLTVCRLALQYLNVPEALREMYRVMVPGGRVLFLVHGPGYMLLSLRIPNMLYVLRHYGLHRHAVGDDLRYRKGQFFTTNSLCAALGRVGFCNISVLKAEEWRFLRQNVYFAVRAERPRSPAATNGEGS